MTRLKDFSSIQTDFWNLHNIKTLWYLMDHVTSVAFLLLCTWYDCAHQLWLFLLERSRSCATLSFQSVQFARCFHNLRNISRETTVDENSLMLKMIMIMLAVHLLDNAYINDRQL